MAKKQVVTRKKSKGAPGKAVATKPQTATKPQATKKRTTKKSSDCSEVLQSLLATPGSAKKIDKLLGSLTEKQRRDLASLCEQAFEEAPSWIHRGDDYHRNPLVAPARVAVLWTGGFRQVDNLRDLSDEQVVEVLAQRKPKWLDQYAEAQLTKRAYWVYWRRVRALVSRKLCKQPANDRYYTGMISGLAGIHFRRKTTVLKELKADPALLKHEVWKLFELEGEHDNSLAAYDRVGRLWATAFRTLAKSGQLSRAKLLDASLDALELGFNQNRSRWYFEFFDFLEPTAAEQKKRIGRFITLLGSPIPPTAKWAFGKVQDALENPTAAQARQAIPAVGILLTAREKGTVANALKLLQKLAKSTPKSGNTVALTATTALGHEKPEIQKAALKLIDSCGDAGNPELAAAVERYVPVVAASFRKQLQSWVTSASGDKAGAPAAKPRAKSTGTKSRKRVADGKFKPPSLRGFPQDQVALLGLKALIASHGQPHPEIPAATFDGTEIPRLDPSRQITPIDDIHELIEVCARVVEDDMLVDDGERVIDGLSRLCGQVPDDFEQLVAPLFKRVVKLLKKSRIPFDEGLHADLWGMVYSWVTRRKIGTKKGKNYSGSPITLFTGYDDGIEKDSHFFDSPRPLSFLSRRSLAISHDLADRKPRLLLSAPTHEGGWIDARTLVQRVNRLRDTPPEDDVVLALLRLAPDHRAPAGKKLKTKLKGEWLNAIQYALGAEGIKIGKSAPLWVSSARARAPFADDARIAKAFPQTRPDGGRAAHYSFSKLQVTTTEKPPKKLNLKLPTQLMFWREDHNSFSFWDTEETAGCVKWSSTLWPIARESYFALGTSRLASNIDWREAAWLYRTYLDPLLDPDTPLREMGLALLLTGLAAKEPGEHGLATDAAIQAISDGRLGTDNLAAALAAYLPSGDFNLTRWSKRFADVAAASDLHAYVVLRAMEGGVRGDVQQLPRGFGDILELLRELSARLEFGFEDPAFRKFLEQFTGSAKAAKAARALLDAETSTAATSTCEGIVRQAIDQRINRLHAWQARK